MIFYCFLFVMMAVTSGCAEECFRIKPGKGYKRKKLTFFKIETLGIMYCILYVI